MIYNEYIDGARLRLEFEAEMVLQSLGERWSRFVWREARRRHSARRDCWRKLEVHIERSAQACAIKHRTVQAGHRRIRDHLGKQRQCDLRSGNAHPAGRAWGHWVKETARNRRNLRSLCRRRRGLWQLRGCIDGLNVGWCGRARSIIRLELRPELSFL